MAFLMLSTLIVILPRASISGDRIADVLATEPAVSDPPQPDRFCRILPGQHRVSQRFLPLSRR